MIAPPGLTVYGFFIVMVDWDRSQMLKLVCASTPLVLHSRRISRAGVSEAPCPEATTEP